MPTKDEIQAQHPEYKKHYDNWQYTLAHYDAERLYDKIGDYVPQKAYGEDEDLYEERLSITEFLPILSAVIDSVVGGVVRRDPDTKREWGALEGTDILDILKRDADLKGTGWSHLQHQKLTDALVFSKAFTLIDTTRGDTAEVSARQGAESGHRPYLSLIPRTAITNWRRDKNGQLVEVVIEEEMDLRSGVFDADDAQVTTYLHLTLEGWARYRVMDDEDEKVKEIGNGKWQDGSGRESQWLGRDGRPRLPLVETTPRVRRYSSFELAHLANEILNINSELRWILRFGGLGQYLVLAIDDDTKYAETIEKLRSGKHRVIREEEKTKGASRLIGPDMAVVEGLVSTINDKLNMYWQAALFEFSDQAVERTATEIKSDFLASLGAFLAQLAEAVEESENEELYLLTQAIGENPENAPEVQRFRDYSVEDAITVFTRIRDLIRGQNQSLVTTPEIEAELTIQGIDAAGLDIKKLGGADTVRAALIEKAQTPPPAAPTAPEPEPGEGAGLETA